MKDNRKFKKDKSASKKQETKEKKALDESKVPPIGDFDAFDETEDGSENNDPGYCIGHYADCEECEICEIQESCKEMTGNINGENNASEK